MSEAKEILDIMYGTKEIDEYWATDKSDEFVVVVNGEKAIRFKAWPETLPSFTPAQWEDENLPHPYNWKSEGK